MTGKQEQAAVDACSAWSESKRAQRTINDVCAEQQDFAVAALRKARLKSLSFEDEGCEVTVTLVEPSALVYDEDKLRKKVGAKVWSSITTAKLDKTKLSEAVRAGKVSPELLAECSTERESTPYLRLTEKKA